jgi:hypothetical protein
LPCLHDWNVFLLCPTCHTVFDEVIKPKLQEAFAKAVGGFTDPPTSKSQPNVKVAETYKEAIERMIEPKAGQKAIVLPDESKNSSIPCWRDEGANRKKRYAKKSKEGHPGGSLNSIPLRSIP